MIKIIGGNKKGYMLSVPKGNLVRPTSGMKKQAVFNILTSRYLKIGDTDLFSKKIVLDAFAGIGGLGLEALSRGAAFCYFVEKSNLTIKYLNNNCLKTLNVDEFKVLHSRYNELDLNHIDKGLDIIFFDPPYDYKISTKTFDIISSKINKNAIFIVETSKTRIVPKIDYLNVIDERFFGRTKISFMTFAS